MQENINRQVVLLKRPEGYPNENDFGLLESSVPEIADGEVLIRTLWLSIDPYMRGRISNMVSPHPIGTVMPGGTVGIVTSSKSNNVLVGSIVESPAGWQDYSVSNARSVRVVEEDNVPVSTALGVLGMPGLTAYHGLFEIGRPKAGDTLVVSAAAGAVGAVVGQLGKISGCRVIGIAGTDAKVSYVLEELGFHAGINYRTQSIDEELKSLCPRGVDIYFDNVGGTITDAVLDQIADRARIIICGQISQYNLEQRELGPRNLWQLLRHQAKIEGFTVGRYANRAEVARGKLNGLVKNGLLKYKEDIVEGLENAPKAFIGMMHGSNFGKLLVKVSDQ